MLPKDSSSRGIALTNWRFHLLLWVFPLLFLAVFFFLPLGKILEFTFDPAVLATPLSLHIVWQRLVFTLYQALLSTLLTFLFGLPIAYLFSCYDFSGKSFLRALTAVPFMLPTVVVAAAFNALVGSHGLLSFLPTPSPFVLILAAHVFYNATIVIRVVGNALSSFDPRLEQVARTLGANSFQVWRRVIFSLLRPSFSAAALLVFLFDFTSFGVILLLGASRYSTLEVEIYLRVLKIPNLPLAALLSVVQLAFTLVLSFLYTRVTSRTVTQAAPYFAKARRPARFAERVFVLGMSIVLLMFYLLPLVSLPVRSLTRLEADRGQRAGIQPGLTSAYYQELFVNRRGSLFYVPPIEAARNSLMYAGLTVFLSLFLGYPAAYALARPTRLEKYLDPLVMLPLGASAVMLGLGFILTFGGALSSPWFVPLAHTLVALPFVIRTLQPAIASMPERLRQAAATLGASPFQVWKTVDLPILVRVTLSAATFAFTVSLGEFGATLLLTRPEYPTIPVAIQRFLSQPGGLNFGQAMAMATILMVLATLAILGIEKLRFSNSGEF